MDATKENTAENNLDDIFDDNLLIKAYNLSVNLSQEELAKRLADAKNTVPTMKIKNLLNESESSGTLEEGVEEEESDNTDHFKVGSYVRANYIDGIDYEAEIISINSKLETAHIKYIGYDNEENVEIADLVPSWGLKERQKQYEEAKADMTDSQSNVEVPNRKSKNKNKSFSHTPTMPPMPSLNGLPKSESQHLHAMLKSWYMSGYYTGIYEGIRMNQQQTSK